ncbi:HlyD family secretion protein [Gracilimonas mengyeensis]|uniref:Multidrug resistance efflux pump n=1 Tax=Gracilimonas mengyeensis TaxID=1302730 RepID=A0A521BK75_9BACT|nr:HlyD family efflux transporter periplasmic adaptor subunit [Gracilimonas mengyeensis]SMO47476.1 Multidrug resistance efflux pump [Gracilimonas mengyeensis]
MSDENKKYERIPVPLSQKLKEVRHRIVPLLVFLVVLGFVVYLWDMRVSTPGFTGKVVADSTLVASPYDGTLNQFYLEPFDVVEKGDPVATIIRTDSSYLQSRLQLVESQINQVRSGLEPMVNHQRNIMDYENLRLDHMQNRVEVASLKIREQQLKEAYERAKELYAKDGISEAEYERIESEYLVVKSERESKTELIDQLAGRLENIEQYIIADDVANPLNAAIDVYEKELKVVEEELKPRTIYAPMSGIVSKVYKHDGEFARAGDQILEIEATEPSYIVGYLRQPFVIEPEEGMEVEVRTRKPSRHFFTSHIVKIGGHIEILEPGMGTPGASAQESGLPIQIAIRNTGDVTLYPGEFVDIVLER